MVMISYFETNEINNTYVNLQTGQPLDLDRVKELKDNAMLKVKPELWIEWDFEKNDELGFDIWKMTKGSDRKAWWVCSECKSEYDASLSHRVTSNSKCPYCAGRKVNHTNSLAVKNPELASEWHPTKNGDLTPNDFTRSGNTRVWWKCEKGHEWEALISSRNSGFRCPYCTNQKTWKGFNDMWTINPELAKLLANHEDGYMYTHYSTQKVDWKCPDCGEIIRSKRISDVNTGCLSCPNCSDGHSFPSKVVYNLLKSLDNINFIKELTYRNFKWVGSKRYDFYIPSLNCIIETHGEQHYEDTFSRMGGRTSEEERKNDMIKRNLALSNGVGYYIELDCRKSDFEYIKESILSSELVEFFDLNNVDWVDVEVKSEKSILFEVCEMWNSGMTVGGIMKETKLSSTTVQKYLERGTKLNVCNYTVSESRSRGKRKLKGLINNNLANQISELWNDGLTVYEIIEKTNLSRSTTIKYLKEGVELGICINYNREEAQRRGSRK